MFSRAAGDDATGSGCVYPAPPNASDDEESRTGRELSGDDALDDVSAAEASRNDQRQGLR